MNRQAVAKELVAVARDLTLEIPVDGVNVKHGSGSTNRTAGSWAFPRNPGDVSKIIKMVERMANGDPPLPGKPKPEDAFYGLLGDDSLFDEFDQQERHYLRGCAEAVAKRIREFAKQPESSFKEPMGYRMIVELAKKLGW